MLDVDAFALKSIAEVNLAYLLLAQRLLQTDFVLGQYRLGIADTTAQALLKLSSAETLKLANTKRLITHFSLTEQQLQQVLKRDKFGSVLQQAHLTILATQQSMAMASAEHEGCGKA